MFCSSLLSLFFKTSTMPKCFWGNSTIGNLFGEITHLVIATNLNFKCFKFEKKVAVILAHLIFFFKKIVLCINKYVFSLHFSDAILLCFLLGMNTMKYHFGYAWESVISNLWSGNKWFFHALQQWNLSFWLCTLQNDCPMHFTIWYFFLFTWSRQETK